MKYDLTHARHDPAHCLTPGLFRSLKRGERKKLKLDVTYKYGYDFLRFTGFEPLDRTDMRLLQGIVAMAGPAGIILSSEPKTEIGQQLRLFLDPRFDAAEKDASVVKSSISRLLKEIGLSDGGINIKAIIASLHRMANVTVLVQKDSRQAVFHLLSYAFDSDDGKLLVALNPRVTQAVLGERPFTSINMSEVRALRSDPAAFIHQRLSGWIDQGKTGKVEIDTLCDYVWFGGAKAEAMKKRRQTIRKALLELVALGWTVEEYARGKFNIGRPAV
ncbi:MAG: replication protein C, IncQ-type [Halothiobacillaceae bacterium]